MKVRGERRRLAYYMGCVYMPVDSAITVLAMTGLRTMHIVLGKSKVCIGW